MEFKKCDYCESECSIAYSFERNIDGKSVVFKGHSDCMLKLVADLNQKIKKK